MNPPSTSVNPAYGIQEAKSSRNVGFVSYVLRDIAGPHRDDAPILIVGVSDIGED